MNRHLPDAARKGRGQPPRRIHVAEQHVRHAVAALYAGTPRLQYRRRLFLQARHGKRPAVDENHDHRFAGRNHGVKQFHLPSGKAQVAAGRILAGPACRFAERENHHIRRFGRRHRPGEISAARRRCFGHRRAVQPLGYSGRLGEIASAHDFQFGPGGQLRAIPAASETTSCQCPRAAQQPAGRLCPGQRPDERNGFCLTRMGSAPFSFLSSTHDLAAASRASASASGFRKAVW